MMLIANITRQAITLHVIFIFAGHAASSPLSDCYERRYDAKYLDAHKGQRVRRVTLAVKPVSASSPWIANAYFRMAIRGKKGMVGVGGGCTKEGEALSCAGDCDTGTFRLAAITQGNVLLTTTDRLLLQRNRCDDESYVKQKPN